MLRMFPQACSDLDTHDTKGFKQTPLCLHSLSTHCSSFPSVVRVPNYPVQMDEPVSCYINDPGVPRSSLAVKALTALLPLQGK